MGIRPDLLGEGEHVVLHMRTHGKALIWPFAALVVFHAALGIGIAAIPPNWMPWAIWVLLGCYAIVMVWLVILPFLRWSTSTYTVTNRRIVTRRGIINKTGHDLPLRRINNVNYERSLTDRILGCGTLVLETAAGQPLVLPDVPKVERVQVSINNLLFSGDSPTLESGEPAHLDD